MTSVGHKPNGPWTFDRSVVDVFDDMLPRSIPDYGQMRSIVGEILIDFLRDRKHPSVLDVGASLGGALRDVAPRIPGIYVLGIDNSPDMVAAAELGVPSGCSVVLRDVVDDGLPDGHFDVVVWCLTLQFLPVEHRARLMAETCKRLRERGGIAVVVEKVQGEHADDHDMLTRLYHNRKRGNGYSEDDVEVKARSLRYVMATLSEAQNVALFERAGFTVQPVWRSLCFAAWVLRPLPFVQRDGVTW